MKRHLEFQDEDIVTTCIEIIQKFIYLWSVMDKVNFIFEGKCQETNIGDKINRLEILDLFYEK